MFSTKKAILLTVVILGLLFSACQRADNYMLGREDNRDQYFEPTPYGMAYIQRAAFTMGANDNDLNETKIGRAHV